MGNSFGFLETGAKTTASQGRHMGQRKIGAVLGPALASTLILKFVIGPITM